MSTVGVNLNQEKLLALILVRDECVEQLSNLAGEAFFRAFISQDRTSGQVRMRFRFRYREKGDSWYSVGPSQQEPAAALREYREGITHVVIEASRQMGITLSPADVLSFEPPDDEGDFERTVQWLLDMDLVHPPRTEKISRA